MQRGVVLLEEAGNLFCCGENFAGQLATGNYESQARFVRVSLAVPLLCISSGSAHTVGVGEDGSLWSWGSNRQGQLGLGNQVTKLATPTRIPDTNGFVAVSASHCFSMALDQNGHVWSFGSNHSGVLGLGIDNREAQVSVPTQIDSMSQIRAISAGLFHVLFLDTQGRLWTVGYNYSHQLGLGDALSRCTPCRIEKQYRPLSYWQTFVSHFGFRSESLVEEFQIHVVKIAAGKWHSLVLDSDGNVWAFGENSQGQYENTGINASWPKLQTTLRNIVEIYAAGENSYAQNADGQVFVFGKNIDEFGAGDNGAPIIAPMLHGKRLIPGDSFLLAVNEHNEAEFYGKIKEYCLIEDARLGNVTLHRSNSLLPRVKSANSAITQ
jgi:alpha-tubulin suppressor-like RCC1 family protein